MSTPARSPRIPPGPSSRRSLYLYRSLNIGVAPNPIFGEIHMMPAGTPILVLKEGTRRERGKGAQFNNIAAAKAVADAVRSTLGRRGLDKMLVESLGEGVITNDGVTILKEIDIEHPAAKMLVEVAKTQDEEAGDGTTTAVILAGELLKRAEDLIEQNIHPTVIAAGYRLASDKAHEVLEEVATKISIKDAEVLKKVAMTSMSSKSASGHKELLADIAVKAVSTVAEKRADDSYSVEDDNIQVVKKQGGSIADTAMVYGIIVDKDRVHPGMPGEVREGKIALIDAALEVKKTEIDAKIEITDPTQLQAFLNEEESMLKRMVETVRKSGANVLFCQKGIDDLAQHYLAKAEIYAVRRVKKSDMEKLAKATGGKVVTKLDELAKDDLGYAKLVYEKKIGEDEMTFVTGCKNPKAVSILIRGGTEHVVDEVERSLEDATSVVAVAIEDGKVITGGGSSATEIALSLRDFAATIGGREQIAIEAFADAMEVIPRTLSENAGLDPIDILIELRKEHKKGNKHAGVNVFTGKVADMKKENVIEPIRVGSQAVSSATDAAVMVLRIDDVIAARSGGGAGGAGPKGGGEGGEGGGDGEEFGGPHRGASGGPQMAEEPSPDWDTGPSSLDRLLRRIDAYRSLPAIGTSTAPALGPPSAIADESDRVREPTADVVVTPARIYVTLELPGVSRETLEVTAEGSRLSVHAIGADGRVFHSEMELLHPVEPQAVTATYRNGVLDVTLPRRRGHQIRIKKGE